jgi:hypothetical protein
VFFAQEREITLTWSLAENIQYRTLFLQRDTTLRDILFQQKNTINPSKSKPGVDIFRPFSHQHLRGFFYTVAIANF